MATRGRRQQRVATLHNVGVDRVFLGIWAWSFRIVGGSFGNKGTANFPRRAVYVMSISAKLGKVVIRTQVSVGTAQTCARTSSTSLLILFLKTNVR